MGYRIGTTEAGMVTVQSLGIPDPKHIHHESSSRRNIISGHTKALGAPWCEWHWDFCKLEWRDALRAFCPAPAISATVYIETRIHEEDEFDVFTAIMEWPEEEDKDSGRRMDFNIKFKHLIAV
jgi:hypothetical protein